MAYGALRCCLGGEREERARPSRDAHTRYIRIIDVDFTACYVFYTAPNTYWRGETQPLESDMCEIVSVPCAKVAALRHKKVFTSHEARGVANVAKRREGTHTQTPKTTPSKEHLPSLRLPHNEAAELREPYQLDARAHARARHAHLSAGGVFRQLSVQVAQLDDRVARLQPGGLRGAATLHLSHDEQPATRLAAQPKAGRAVTPHVNAQPRRS